MDAYSTNPVMAVTSPSSPILLEQIGVTDHLNLFEFEAPQSPNYQDLLDNVPAFVEATEMRSSERLASEMNIQTDEDKIFQIDKSHLIHGPTFSDLQQLDVNDHRNLLFELEAPQSSNFYTDSSGTDNDNIFHINKTDSIERPTVYNLKRRDVSDHRNLQSPLSPNFQEIVNNIPDYIEDQMMNTELLARDMDIQTNIMRIDDDGIFKLNMADLIQGPTIAEIYAHDQNLSTDINFDDLPLPDENTNSYLNGADMSTSFEQIINNNNGSVNEGDNTTFSPTSSNSTMLCQTVSSPVSPLLYDLLEWYNDCSADMTPSLDQSEPEPTTPAVIPPVLKVQRISLPARSLLKRSEPTHLDEIRHSRKPRKHSSAALIAEARSTSPISMGDDLSPKAPANNRDSNDVIIDLQQKAGKERSAVQMNMELAYRPKGVRLMLKPKTKNPQVLHDITDLVFRPDCVVRVGNIIPDINTIPVYHYA